MITQTQFNELVYFALQTHMTQIKSHTWDKSFGSDGWSVEMCSEGSLDDLRGHIAKRLFCARFHSVDKGSIGNHLHYRYQHLADLIANTVGHFKKMTDSAQSKDIKESLLDFLSLTALSQENTSRLEDEIPSSIVMGTINSQLYFMPRHPPSEEKYLKLLTQYKSAVIDKLNRHFHCNFDYTYLGSEKPWLIKHFFEIYGAELFITTATTLAAYFFNPMSILAKVVAIDFPSLHLGADLSDLLIHGFLNQPLPLFSANQYLFNPHRHVKIWLSKEPDLFLNQENQLRLIKIRVTNPKDEIHLVYSKELLSKAALINLSIFCNKHHIIPVCIEDKVLPACLENTNEKKLISLYQQEIRALKQGGNLAAASDILRWLKPIYSLGSYSDFDVQVDTSSAPPEKVVDAPILFNIGSVICHPNGMEGLGINNDVISIVDCKDASDRIHRIQTSIIDACVSPIRFTQRLNKLMVEEKESGIKTSAIPGMDEVQHNPDFVIIALLSFIELNVAVEANLSSFRKLIIELTDSNESFLELMSAFTMAESLAVLEEKLMEATLKKSISLGPVDHDELITMARKDYQEQCLKVSVMQTTGPIALFAAFKSYATASEMEQNRRFSYSNYNLKSCFPSNNSVEFHSTQDEISKLSQLTVGEVNDASWLESGQKRIENTESLFNRSASILQRSFKRVMKAQQKGLDDSENAPQEGLKKND